MLTQCLKAGGSPRDARRLRDGLDGDGVAGGATSARARGVHGTTEGLGCVRVRDVECCQVVGKQLFCWQTLLGKGTSHDLNAGVEGLGCVRDVACCVVGKRSGRYGRYVGKGHRLNC